MSAPVTPADTSKPLAEPAPKAAEAPAAKETTEQKAPAPAAATAPAPAATTTATAAPAEQKQQEEKKIYPPGIPPTMRAVRVVKYITDMKAADVKENLEVQTVPTPLPKSGEVLIRVERSPINPSDLASLTKPYDPSRASPLPAPCGLEGCGTVVLSGGGFMAWRLTGKRVAAAVNGSGMWSEFVIASAFQAVPLPDTVSFDDGSSCFVNPLTVVAFVEIAKAGKHKTVLHTAAASALGRMLIRYGRRNGVDVLAVVRNAKHKVYGGLAMEAVSGVSMGDLISGEKKISGFYLPVYLRVVSRLQDDFRTPIQASFPLEHIGAALKTYLSSMSAGKVLIAPPLKEPVFAQSKGTGEAKDGKDKEKDAKQSPPPAAAAPAASAPATAAPAATTTTTATPAAVSATPAPTAASASATAAPAPAATATPSA